jgi:RTX calcium-binding nonapeptide repeat (4 copies)
MSHRTPVRALVLAACALALSALAAPSALAAVTCNLAGPTLTVDHPSGIDDVTIRVNTAPSPDVIEVLDDGTPVVCGGGTPTVTGTNTVSYTNTNGISDVILEEPDRLAPGSTIEAGGASEIELSLATVGGILSEVKVVDADGAGDTLVLGAGGLNFNSDDDADITGLAAISGVAIVGGAGGDVFDARGSAATGAAFPNRVDLTGAGGADQLFGGAQRDDVDGGEGDDLMDGGGNVDELDYSASTAPVSIDLAAAGPQNGGSLGMDTLAGFEDVTGSKQDDVLRGTDGENSITGLSGDDLVEGRGGDDFMDGGAGVDTASYESAPVPVSVDLALGDDEQDTGGAGKDYLYDRDLENLIGSASADQLRGTNGVNRIDGGGGGDTIAALGGDDFVAARDGAGDSVDCGEGTDGGSFDRASLDTAVVSCELGAFEPEPDTAVAFSLSGKRSQRLRGGSIAVRVRCSGEPCRVAATASVNVPGRRAARLVRFRGARTRLAANESKTLRLKLGRRGLAQVKRALATGSRLTARVRVTATDTAGNRDTERMGVRLRR